MKIAYIINQYPKVSHSFIRREIQALEQVGVSVVRIAMRGWDADVVDPSDRDERAITKYVLGRGAGRLLGATLRTLVTSPARFFAALRVATKLSRRSDRSLLLHWIYLLEACVVARWARQSQVSHLHAHFGTNPAEVAMLAGMIAGLPFSFTVHGPEEFDHPEALGLPEKIRRAAFVVAISSYGRSQLFRWSLHDAWDKIHVVHCGLDEMFLEDAAVPIPAAPRLVCVGRLCEQKGQLLLVDAMKRLIQSGTACELVLAGDGEFRALIETRLRELGIQSHVRITGWISSAQVRDEIQAARALVLPSFAEGLPVVIMESMALERPVISTYVAGIPELVLDRQVGWLVPAGDVAALVEGMRQCLQVPLDEAQRMGRAARTRVLARHDVRNSARELAALFAGHRAQQGANDVSSARSGAFPVAH